jgi:glucose-1-phosphate thymidylyltransferase
MKIIIPAAGEGVRLRPHTLTRPKPLLRIAGKTVIDHLLEPLVELEPSEVSLVVGYRGKQMAEYVRQKYDFKLTTVEQDQLLGLGYAVQLALERMSLDEEVLVILADTIIQADFQAFVSAGENVLALKEVADPRRFGVAETEGASITKLVEKPREPKSNLAVVGLYYFRRPRTLLQALAALSESGRKTAGEIQLTDALSDMLGAGEPFTPFSIDGWLDCGKRETMLETNARLLAAHPRIPAYISDSHGVNVEGAVWIGDNVQVENSTIGPNVTIYENCKISESRLQNCIIGPGCVLTNSSLEDSILGENVSVHDQNGVFDVGDDGLAEPIEALVD